MVSGTLAVPGAARPTTWRRLRPVRAWHRSGARHVSYSGSIPPPTASRMPSCAIAGLEVTNMITPGLGRLHRVQLLAVQVADGAEPLAGRHLLPGLAAASHQPATGERSHTNRRTRLWPAGGGSRSPSSTPQHPKRVLQPGNVGGHRRLVHLAAASHLGRDRGDAGRRGGVAGGAADRLAGGGADQIAQPEGHRHRVRLLLHRRLVVQRERLQRLHQVAAVQVDAAHRWARSRARTAACASASEKLPSASPGKQRLRFLPSSGVTNGLRARNAVTFTIGTATIEPRSRRRVEAAHEPHERPDRGVLAAVDAGDQRHPRAVAAARLHQRQLDALQQPALQPQRSAIDHAASPPSTVSTLPCR